ncbi:hypothetical protein FA95DRAFT_1565105 [Auriscalpium vulgare]|uniref:Uncharacterized protein n=1 Tax=Auriscalpium vulgare TaxID=40419 RepID=A0ACB8RCM1_9AGAM|nr:hypothetical protein FA95DRAFT_1565105 [Auriscalpium vulgare]
MSAPLAATNAIHTPVETHTQHSTFTTTQSAVLTSTSPAQLKLEPLARRISQEATCMLRDYFDNHNHYPTRREKEYLVQKVEAIDGPGTYDILKLQSWFTYRRTKIQRGDNKLEKKGRAELLYPSLTQANIKAINLCLEETRFPSDAHLDIWAKRLDVDRGELSMYVTRYGSSSPFRRRSAKPAAIAAAMDVDDSTRDSRDAGPTPLTQPLRGPLEIPYPTPTSATFPSPAPNDPIRARATSVAVPVLVPARFLSEPQPHELPQASPVPPTADLPPAPALLPPGPPIRTSALRPAHTPPKELLIHAVRAAREAASAMPPPPVPMTLQDFRRTLDLVEERGERFLAAVRSGGLASYGISPAMAHGRPNSSRMLGSSGSWTEEEKREGKPARPLWVPSDARGIHVE